MKTISIIAPVIVMLLIGVFCNRTKLISKEGIANIKKYITQIALPITIFHAIAAADYSLNTAIIFGIMMGAIIIAFIIGILLKGIIKEPYRRFFPFLITIYEGGMMGYPLYMNLYGADKLSNIVLIDMAGCVFSFGFFIAYLQLVDSGEKFSIKSLAVSSIKNPCFVGLVIGLFVGLTGLMQSFLKTDVSQVYLSVKDLIVAPLSAMILLVVGYDFALDKERIGICLKTAGVRIVVQSLLFCAVFYAANLLNLNKYMIGAFSLYFFLTPSLGLTSYVKTEEGGKYIATTASLYTIVTIIAYIVVAIVMG